MGGTSVGLKEPEGLSVERCLERNTSQELRSERHFIQKQGSQPLSSNCKKCGNSRLSSQKRMSEHGVRILTSMNSMHDSKEDLDQSGSKESARVKAMTLASKFLKEELVKEQ